MQKCCSKSDSDIWLKILIFSSHCHALLLMWILFTEHIFSTVELLWYSRIKLLEDMSEPSSLPPTGLHLPWQSRLRWTWWKGSWAGRGRRSAAPRTTRWAWCTCDASSPSCATLLDTWPRRSRRRSSTWCFPYLTGWVTAGGGGNSGVAKSYTNVVSINLKCCSHLTKKLWKWYLYYLQIKMKLLGLFSKETYYLYFSQLFYSNMFVLALLKV